MRALQVALAAVLLAGCISSEAISAAMRRESSLETRCPESQIQVLDYHGGAAGLYPSTWTAMGCEKEWACQLFVYSGMTGTAGPPTTRCREVVR